MPRVDSVVETRIDPTARVRQFGAMFDVPLPDASRLEWHGELDIESRPWNVGLIVGPSGSGKTTIMRDVFGQPAELAWSANSVLDDFAAGLGIDAIARICQAVGFNTIPAWFRPYAVLSNGERFRVDIARRLLELADPIVVDEFTSVVDRQVAQIGAHAVQKYVRQAGRQFVGVACHYDIIEWLQPDWTFEPATMVHTWRSVQRRPDIACEIARCDHSAWRLFAPFHYLTAELNKAAACYVLFANGEPAAFAGVLHRPAANRPDGTNPRNLKGVSRLVTLPDWQGMGLAMALVDELAAAYKAAGLRLRMYPSHPSLIRSFDRSPRWALVVRPGNVHVGGRAGKAKPNRSNAGRIQTDATSRWKVGSRPCAIFEYAGAAADADAARLVA